ncbi:MAG: hypothetical protein DMG07_28845, partial [Acidobacteria bacterium]
NLSGYVTIGYSEGQTAWSAMAYYRATQDSLGGHRVLGLAEADMHEPGGPATWKPYGHLQSEAAMYVYAYALTGDETYLPHAVTSMTAFKKGWMPQKNLEVMYWLERTESRHPAR